MDTVTSPPFCPMTTTPEGSIGLTGLVELVLAYVLGI
jgi:hypothetical protein